MRPRPPGAHNRMGRNDLNGGGLRWHGPTHALRARVPPVVGAPRRSYGYASSRRHRIWGRGIPGTRAQARVAGRCISTTGC
jgi:hypothetical protein